MVDRFMHASPTVGETPRDSVIAQMIDCSVPPTVRYVVAVRGRGRVPLVAVGPWELLILVPWQIVVLREVVYVLILAEVEAESLLAGLESLCRREKVGTTVELLDRRALEGLVVDATGSKRRRFVLLPRRASFCERFESMAAPVENARELVKDSAEMAAEETEAELLDLPGDAIILRVVISRRSCECNGDVHTTQDGH